MEFDRDDIFGDLEDDLDSVPSKKSTNQQKFPCGQCSGTGKYQGARIHQPQSHCFACGGRGYFKTDPRKLKQQRQRRQEKKAEQMKVGLEAFKSVEPDMFKELAEAHAVGHQNDFIRSLAEQLFKTGQLSDTQVAAWHRGKRKLAAMKAEREARIAESAMDVDLSPIRAMFDTALANGYKRPMYRAEGIRIKPGKERSLYVMTENRMEIGTYGEQPGYEGKIVGEKFLPARRCEDDTKRALKVIAADPLAAALRYGQRTGRCSCCGRELTKHTSIDAGIGPICAEKWGL